MHPATPEQPAGSRVLVALDASARSVAALATAGALAAELDAELAGLFVEDIGLQRLMALPFARELCALSGELRPLSRADVEHAWRREAETLQRRLAEAASALRLRWSFEVARGRIAVEVDTRIAAFDLVVLGQRGGFHMPEPSARRTARTGPVLVWLDPADASDGALELAARLARRSGSELVVLRPATAMAVCPPAWSAQRDIAARCVTVDSTDRHALARAVRREAASCLVLGGHSRLALHGKLAPVLDAVECPVVLSR